MPQPWQRPLIRAHEQDCQNYLDEVREAGDLDLWAELAAKMCDVLLVHRREGKPVPPSTFTFSDGITRDLNEMAFAHAVAEVFGELDMDDEYPAWMGRGERGA